MRLILAALAFSAIATGASATEYARIGEPKTLACHAHAPTDCVELAKNTKVTYLGDDAGYSSIIKIPGKSGEYLVDKLLLDHCFN